MSVNDLETRINDWVAKNDEWEGDATEHTLQERNTNLDGSGETYYTMDVRFRQRYSKPNVLQKFTDKLKKKVDWYRVGYHACSHDEDEPHACAWDDTVEWTAKGVAIASEVRL